MTFTSTDASRRRFLGAGLCFAGLVAAGPLHALSSSEARRLVDRLVAEINSVINSGRSESQMFGDFERIFRKYADVPIIARTILGRADWERASSAQRNSFIDAFTVYISRKYGKRFRELIGGKVIVRTAVQNGTVHEVRAVADLRGSAPFEVAFRLSEKSGKGLFFDMLIEGISLLKAERAEVGAMLDRRRGDLNAMITDLRRAG